MSSSGKLLVSCIAMLGIVLAIIGASGRAAARSDQATPVAPSGPSTESEATSAGIQPATEDPCAVYTNLAEQGLACVLDDAGQPAIVEVATSDPCDISVPTGWTCSLDQNGQPVFTQDTSTSPEAAAPEAPVRDIINQNMNNVAVDVAVVNQTGGNGRVSLPECPDIFDVQRIMGVLVQKVAGEPCAFNIRWMSEAHAVTTGVGWATELQVDSSALIVFQGDGRTYEGIAITTRPAVRNICDQWAGSYRQERLDDARGVGYDAYVVLPPEITTCTVTTPEGTLDALSLGRVIDASALDDYVADGTDVQPDASVTVTEPSGAEVVETPVASDAQPVITSEAEASPAAASEAQACPPTAEMAAELFGGVATDYVPVGTNGWQYLGSAAQSFTVPSGMVVDYPGGRAVAGEELTDVSIFTAYWLSCG